MARPSRATALKIAALLSFAMAVYGLLFSLSYVGRGAASLNTAGDAPPYIVVVLGVVLANVEIISAYGVWQNRRWAVALTIFTHVLDMLAAAPGIVLAPTTSLWLSSLSGVFLSIVIIGLCLWRDRSPATL